MVASHLVNAKNSKVIEKLALAISNQEQVYLKKYQSINSETITDRLIEPFGFTENYTTVMAYEIASAKNKTFHLDRITASEFNNRGFMFEEKHEKQIPDAFGFSFQGEQHEVELDLSLKAYLLLKDEYPLTIPYIKYNPKSDLYELKIQVNDLKPIQRFMRGMESK